MGILFLETSAKSGKNVKEVFMEIAKRLPINKNEKDPNTHVERTSVDFSMHAIKINLTWLILANVSDKTE